ILPPAELDCEVATFHVAGFVQTFLKRRYHLRDRPTKVKKSDHWHRALLRARRERLRDCRAAEQRDELAPLHSITSSAVESSVGGTATPSILAVQALMTNSNLVDCTTGKSAGFAPLRMRPA